MLDVVLVEQPKRAGGFNERRELDRLLPFERTFRRERLYAVVLVDAQHMINFF